MFVDHLRADHHCGGDGDHSADPSVLLGSFVVGIVLDIIIGVVMTCFHSLLVFAFPLILIATSRAGTRSN